MEGYIYCFSNLSMTGILKIGMTERTPEIRLKEANMSDTWRPPTPYKIEFAKKVNNPKQKEKTLHILLSQYTERINPKREFFRVSLEEVKTFFDLMDGEFWIKNTIIDNEIVDNEIVDNKTDETETDETETDDENDETDENETDEKNEELIKDLKIKGCRDMKKCFTNGQKIKHTIGINKIWIGTYDLFNNTILYDGRVYGGRSPINQFVISHYQFERPDRVSVNAWSECECEINGEWISTYNLNTF